MSRAGILLFLLLFFITDLLAFTYATRVFSVDQGLPDETTAIITQDREGYLLVGTFQGLVRFDGEKFFRFENSGKFERQGVWSIYEDSAGRVWAGAGFRAGAARYNNGKWESVEGMEMLNPFQIASIMEDRQGVMWFAVLDSGIVKYDGEKWQRIQVAPDISVSRIMEDSKGRIWFSSSQGAGLVEGEDRDKLVFLYEKQGGSFRQISEDSGGNLWFASFGQGVFKYDGAGWTQFTDQNGLSNNNVYWVMCDSRDCIWACTESGINLYENGEWTVIGIDQGLPDNDIRCVFEDREGNIWVGTGKSGVVKLIRSTVYYSMQDGLGHNVVNSVLHDSKGRYWFGHYNGLTMLDGRKWKTFDNSSGLPENEVFAVREDMLGRIWIGCMSGGVAYFNGNSWTAVADDKLRFRSRITGMLCDNDNTIWVASLLNGIRAINSEGIRCFSVETGMKTDAIYSLYKDAGGGVWACTDSGLFKFESGQWKDRSNEYGVQGGVNYICEDSQGKVWTVASNNNITWFDGRQSREFVLPGKSEGSYPTFLVSIGEYMYLGSNTGIYRFNEKSALHFDSGDWLPVNVTNTSAGFRDRNNQLWVGTIKGLVRYNPALETGWDAPPLIQINSVSTLDDEPVSDGAELEHRKNYLMIRYRGICLKNPQSLVYEVLLEGADKDWKQTALNTIQYYNLPHGDYRFNVIVKNKNGIWSEKTATFSFVIKPPLWLTPWFIGATLILLLGLIYGAFIFWYKMKSAEDLKEKNAELNRYLVLLNREIEERKNKEKEKAELQEQLFQSQKMETIGLLAGGVAHDLNNFLTPVISYADLLLMNLDGQDPNYGHISEIREAGLKMAALTSQLLAFSRRQVLELKVINMNELIESYLKMTKRFLGENIELAFFPCASLGNIKADPDRLQQVLMNLTVNARDAMPEGGRLSIETANVFLDEEYVQNHSEVKTGDYVMVSVSDDGCGMDQETRNRIFEPFFTTKGRGRGTGLGLSTVYGIVKQHGGSLWVYSEPGVGTTFKVYFPRVDSPTERLRTETPKTGELSGDETILIVEDERKVMEIAVRILIAHGYHVIFADSAGQAEDRLQELEVKPSLLLTDVILSDSNGKQMFERMVSKSPGLKVLYMSGYADNVIAHHGVLETGVHFLQKPFTARTLLEKVRQALDSVQ